MKGERGGGGGAHRVASGTTLSRGLLASLRMRMRYCVILVSRCLFLCTRNLGQYARCSSICAAERRAALQSPRPAAAAPDPTQCSSSWRLSRCALRQDAYSLHRWMLRDRADMPALHAHAGSGAAPS